MATPEEELVERLIRSPKQVLVIIGSGISIATTKNTVPCASWTGLLEHGINHVEQHGLQQKQWLKLRRRQLKAKEFIEVASTLTEVLGGPKDGRFKGWIQSCFELMRPLERALLHSIHRWGALLSTTNYDT